MTRVRNVCRMVAVVTLVAAAAAVGNIWSNEGGGGLAPSPALAEDATEAATVRIAAQRVESGRTAFALQVRGEDGWGERIRPRLSSFRRVEDATVGRWANSSLLELESGHTVRISARAQEDGRIEFALQEIIDGEPAERIFPRLNKFPASPDVGKWLYSSAIQLTGAEPSVEEPMPEESNETDDPNPADSDEPTWTPITDEQQGTTDAGASYMISYPEWTDGERFTQISVLASERTSDSDGPPVALAVYCWPNGDRRADINHLPIAAGTHTVRSRVDDRDWAEQELTFNAHSNEGSWFTVADDYEAMRAGSTLEVEIHSNPMWQGSFNLAALFTTPVQTNIDNCGVPVWPEPEPTYVPWTGEEQFSASVDYRAYVSGDGVNTDIHNRVPTDGAVNGQHMFHVSCWADGTSLNMQVLGFPMGEQRPIEVTITFADGSTHVSDWRVSDWNGNGVQTALPSNLLARFIESSSATFTIEGVEYSPMTFDLTSTFETPVQENIDNCGVSVRNASRELDLPESPVVFGNVWAPHGESQIVSYVQPSGGALPFVWSSQLLSSDGAYQFYMRALCGPGGTAVQVFGPRFGELAKGDLRVTWSVDGGSEQTETWRVVDFLGRPTAHPVMARDVINAWRDGTTLDLTLHTAEPHTQRFHLAELFSTPIQARLDECLDITPPDLAAPAGEIARTEEGNLTYGSGAAHGGTVKSTSLAVQLPSDDLPTGFSSALNVNCGMGGTGIVVDGLGQDRPMFIRGYSVEVTWSVDGGPESTSTWDVWPFNVHYYSASPPDDAAFYAAIKDADSLTIKVASDPEFIETYDLAGNGFWETPVQPNLDACIGS